MKRRITVEVETDLETPELVHYMQDVLGAPAEDADPESRTITEYGGTKCEFGLVTIEDAIAA